MGGWGLAPSRRNLGVWGGSPNAGQATLPDLAFWQIWRKNSAFQAIPRGFISALRQGCVCSIVLQQRRGTAAAPYKHVRIPVGNARRRVPIPFGFTCATGLIKDSDPPFTLARRRRIRGTRCA